MLTLFNSHAFEPDNSKQGVKSMPQKLLFLALPYAKDILIPFLGFGTFYGFVQGVEKIAETHVNPLYILGGAAIIGILSILTALIKARTQVQVVGLETKVKEIDITESADNEKTSLLLQIFDKATLDIERTRTHFTEELKNQRADFFEKERETREHYEKRKDEKERHYEIKEEELRQSYHKRLAEASEITNRYLTRCTKIEAQLESLGITVDSDCKIILPTTFERRKP